MLVQQLLAVHQQQQLPMLSELQSLMTNALHAVAAPAGLALLLSLTDSQSLCPGLCRLL